MERLSKTAKGLDTFFKVIYYIWLVGTVLSVVVILFALYLTTGGMNLFGDIGISMLRELDFGSIAINLSSKVVLPEEIGLYYCIVSLIVGFLGIPITYLMIRFTRNILKPMIEKEPFHETLAINLKRLAWLVLVDGLLKEGYELINSIFIRRYIDWNTLFYNEYITGVQIDYTFNTTFIIFAIALYMLSHVFKYGQELQQLSDETL